MLSTNKINKSVWKSFGALSSLIVLLPLFVLALSWFASVDPKDWSHIRNVIGFEVAQTTLLLFVLVGIGTLVLGVGLAYLVTIFSWPLRKIFSVLFILPLALPTYVYAFVFVDLFSFAGPIQSTARSLGFDLNGLEFKNVWGAALIYTLSFYPYVFLLSRQAFKNSGRKLEEAGRSLRSSPWKIFFKLQIPFCLPAIMAGLQLVLMELLADFGAASILNLKTLTTTIYKAWYGFFSPVLASQIASVLVLIAFFIFYTEQKIIGRKSFSLIRSENEVSKKRKAKPLSCGIFITVSLLVISFSLVLPLSRLIWSSSQANFKVYANSFAELSLNTMALGFMGSASVVLVALLLVAMSRFIPGAFATRVLSIVRLGYAIPGTVLAVALFLPIQYLNKVPFVHLFLGGVTALVTGYVVRFLSVGLSPLKNTSQRRPSVFEDAARSLGASQLNVFFKVTIPMLWPSMIKAFLLVFVDIVKEMPLTLMLRPFGWDTFAVTIFSLSSEGLWSEASIPSLILIGFGVIPCYLLIHDRKSNKRISHAKG